MLGFLGRQDGFPRPLECVWQKGRGWESLSVESAHRGNVEGLGKGRQGGKEEKAPPHL